MSLDLCCSTVLIVGLRRRIAKLIRLRIVGLGRLREVGLSRLCEVGLSRLREIGLGVDRLKLSRCGGSTGVGVTGLRKVGANGRVEGVDLFLKVDWSRGPLEVLHVH